MKLSKILRFVLILLLFLVGTVLISKFAAYDLGAHHASYVSSDVITPNVHSNGY